MENRQIVRVYMVESDVRIKTIIDYLHNEAHVQGVTVFRGISGYGSSGQVHSSKLLYTSLDLPIVIEFFDTLEKIEPTIEHFKALLGEGHIITWPIRVV